MIDKKLDNLEKFKDFRYKYKTIFIKSFRFIFIIGLNILVHRLIFTLLILKLCQDSILIIFTYK